MSFCFEFFFVAVLQPRRFVLASLFSEGGEKGMMLLVLPMPLHRRHFASRLLFPPHRTRMEMNDFEPVKLVIAAIMAINVCFHVACSCS